METARRLREQGDNYRVILMAPDSSAVLPGYEVEECFLDCYKGCLVNLDRVVEIERCDFRLDNGDPVQIRKRGSRQVKECYLQYRCRRESMP